MKTIALCLTLAAGIGTGVVINRCGRSALLGRKVSAVAEGVVAPGQPGKGTVADSGTRDPVSFAVGNTSAAVKALLAGFDRRKPVQSQMAVLEKIMSASPGELAAMAKEMSGAWRRDTSWWQTKSAVVQRWVELAPDEAIAWAKVAHKTSGGSTDGAEVLGLLATLDPTRALAEAQGLTNPGLKNTAIETVMISISQADPEEAFRLCHTLPREQRRNVYFNVVENWADRNPAAAAAGVVSLKERNERGQAASALMLRWASQDPAGALAWAKGLAEPSMREQSLRTYFGMVGHRDAEAAIALISEFPRFQQPGFFSNLVGSWIGADPEAATAWVLSRPNAVEQQQLVMSAVNNLSHLEAEQAAKLVSKLTPGTERERALQVLFRQWTSSDPDAAVAFSKTLPPAEEMRVRRHLVLQLASDDSERAMTYLKEHPIDDPASEVWSGLAGVMAAGSPAKALEWANGLSDEVSQRKALLGVFSQWAYQNPAEGAAQAAALTDEAARIECLSTVVGTWASSGLNEALAWANELTGKDRETAMGVVLSKGAAFQPTTAAEQFDALIGAVPSGVKPAEGLLGAASAIASAYFAENAQAAAQWAATLVQDDARAAAVKSLAQRWAQQDAAGASEWIGSLPQGLSRDAAVGELVGKIALSDPASAFAWASTVADSGDRSNLLQTTFAAWRNADAPAARAAIDAADWPDAEKAKWYDKLK